MFSWLNKQNAVIGLVLGILGLAFPVYLEYFQVQTELTLDRVASVDTFAINRASDKLKVFFDGEEVDPQKVNITWDKISLENTGNRHITQDLFDKEDEWGIKIIDGEILDIGSIETSDDYLKKRFTPKLRSQEIIFPKVIFETKEKISFEIVVRHSSDLVPRYDFFGKVAGVHFKYIDSWKNDKRDNLFNQTFSGSLATQAIRTVSYFFGFLLFISSVALFAVLIGYILQLIGRPSRRRTFQKKSFKDISPEVRDIIGEIYIKRGESDLWSFYSLLNDPRARRFLYVYISRQERRHSEEVIGPMAHRENYRVRFFDTESFKHEIQALIKEKAITMDNKNVIVDKPLLKAIMELLKA